jgi:hypothetical protein
MHSHQLLTIARYSHNNSRATDKKDGGGGKIMAINNNGAAYFEYVAPLFFKLKQY